MDNTVVSCVPFTTAINISVVSVTDTFAYQKKKGWHMVALRARALGPRAFNDCVVHWLGDLCYVAFICHVLLLC